MFNQKVILKKAIGKGGFGTVYLADVENDQGFRKRIAIKQLNPDIAESSEALARQLAEARLLGMLNHEHIVQVYDLGRLDNKLSIFMEYIEGVSLSHLLKTSKIPIKSSLQIIGECADALHSAYHTLNPMTGECLEVIHRDIKPANILISKTGTTKLLDFGIAKANFDRGIETQAKQIGTLRYMSPEQWLEGKTSEKVDIYALGFTFLELLHQKFLPRLVLDETIFQKQQRALILKLSLPPEIKEPLQELLSKMLSFDPEDRPSALECKEACFEILEQSSGQISGQSLRIFAQETIPDMWRLQTNSFTDISIPTESMSFTSLQKEEATEIPATTSPSNRKPVLLLALLALAFLAYLAGTPSLETERPQRISTQELPSPIAERQVPLPLPEPIIENVPEVTISKPTLKTKTIPSSPPIELLYFETSFSSIPLGADIFLDGKHIGKTMLLRIKIPTGAHQIRMVFADQVIERNILLKHPTRFVWKIGAEQWLSYLD